jgi:hypothetical protein
MTYYLKRALHAASWLGISFFICFPVFGELPAGYTGQPFRAGIQSIPGIIYCWRYDVGGKNVSWFDVSGGNSGNYNRGVGAEDVDMKTLDPGWDHVAAGFGSDTMLHYSDSNNVYIGYTENPDWQKTTVDVKTAGTYAIDFMVTACCAPNDAPCNAGCIPTVRIDFLDGTDSVSTDTVTFSHTGYYHTYKYEADLKRITLKQGIQVQRLEVVGDGPFNMWYFKYNLLSTPVTERRCHFGAADALKTESVTRTAGGGIAVDFKTSLTGPVTISCFDSRGRRLSSQTMAAVHSGFNKVTLDGHFSAGAHLIKLTQGENSTVSRVFVGAR